MSPNQGDGESPALEPSPEDQGRPHQEQRTRGCLDKGVEHCSQGLELYRALLHSIQSSKVQIGLEVIRKPSCLALWHTCVHTHTHTEQQNGCCDLREVGSLMSSDSGALGGGLLGLHTLRGSSEAGAVSPEGSSLCPLISGTLRGLLLTPPRQ